MMKRNRKAMLAAGLLTGAAALTGCSAMTTPVATPTPDTAQQVTAQPQPADTTVSPDESPTAGGEETPGPIALRVDGEDIEAGAVMEEDTLYLPLEETAKALGWDAKSEAQEEETLVRRSVELSKDESRISVSWVSSDNTAKQITWQKDGLLIPVDTELTSVGDVVYVPAAFFETAMRVRVDRQESAVAVHKPEPKETPANDVDNADENEAKEDVQNG